MRSVCRRPAGIAGLSAPGPGAVPTGGRPPQRPAAPAVERFGFRPAREAERRGAGAPTARPPPTPPTRPPARSSTPVTPAPSPAPSGAPPVPLGSPVLPGRRPCVRRRQEEVPRQGPSAAAHTGQPRPALEPAGPLPAPPAPQETRRPRADAAAVPPPSERTAARRAAQGAASEA